MLLMEKLPTAFAHPWRSDCTVRFELADDAFLKAEQTRRALQKTGEDLKLQPSWSR